VRCSVLGAAGSLLGFYAAVSGLGALSRAYPVPPGLDAREAAGLAVAVAIAGAALGARVGPECLAYGRDVLRSLERRLSRLPAVEVLAGAVGVILGLVVAFLLSPALWRLGRAGTLLSVAVTVALAWLGGSVFAHKREEWLSLFLPGGGRPQGAGGAAELAAATGGVSPWRPASPPLRAAHREGKPKVLDTSAVIDGRVVELYRAGFLQGELVVPTAVLDELRHIADSADPSRRQRGRYGLEQLHRLQQELRAPVVIAERDPAPGQDVDSRLVLLARELGADVVTTDYNLNKVAELQGVRVLNVNELASVLRPRYLRGEELTVRIVGDGKLAGQGVGYLPDGTMVVVEGGRRFLNEDVEVEVTSSHQTVQGLMIFGRPRTGRSLERVGQA
jgi:uncharacterized protein YacL